jgi:hypothetical protein
LQKFWVQVTRFTFPDFVPDEPADDNGLCSLCVCEEGFGAAVARTIADGLMALRTAETLMTTTLEKGCRYNHPKRLR